MTRIFLGLCCGVTLSAQEPVPDRTSDPSRFIDLFRPAQTQIAVLSPDGANVAYSFRENDKLSVVIVDAANPATVRARVLVAEDRTSTARFSEDREPTPARITWMQWVTASRLVIATNTQVTVGATQSIPGVVMAIEADGSKPRILATPRDLKELAPSSIRTFRQRSDERMFPTDLFSSDNASDSDSTATGTATDRIDDTIDAASTIDAMDGDVQTTSLAPRIVDLDTAHPGSVLLRTVGSSTMTVWRLDTETGKISALHDDPINETLSYLLDRQGRPRISAPSVTTIKFPHHLHLEDGPGAKRSHDLTKAAGINEGAGFVVSPENFFRERAIPLGFDENPAILYYASNFGRDTYGIYSVDLATGKRTGLTIENRGLDLIGLPEGAFGPSGTLVYDRYTRHVAGIRLTDRLRTTRWFSENLQAIQALMEKSLPGRTVDIIDWDAEGSRFLATTSGPTDPGGFVILDAKTKQLREFSRRAPWFDRASNNRTMSFVVTVEPGVDLACRITFSAQPRVKGPQPLIIICPSTPWESLPVDFQPEVQALADMGFAVAQPASRGAWGYGVARRETINQGYDDAQVADLARVAEEIAKAFVVDPKRVGLIGTGHGAFVALRAMQLQPQRFRCAVALEPIVDLGGWLARERFGSHDVGLQLVRSYYGPPAKLAKNSLMHDAERIVKPLLILSYPGPEGGQRRDNYVAAKSFARAVRRDGVEVDFADFSQDFNQGLPQAKAAVYRQVEDFLNANVYNFKVKIGNEKVVPNTPAGKK